MARHSNLRPLPGESQAKFLQRVRASQGAAPTGTLGLARIQRPTAPAAKASTPITRGPGPVTRPRAPVVPKISAGAGLGTRPPILESDFGPKAREGFQAGELSAPTNIFPASETLLGSFQGIGPSPILPALPFADPGVRQGEFLRGLTPEQLGGGTPPLGTLGLGKPQQITDRTQFSVPSRVGEIVTGGELRQQNFLKTLNNPRTLGEFEYIGALPSIQAALAAYLRGEDVNPAFVRFFFNQGLVTADADGQLTLTSDGQGTLDAGRTTLVNRAPLFSGEPGRFSGTRGASLGLTNWRI